MTNDDIAGSTQQVEGTFKEASSKFIGAPTLFVDDIAEKTEGKTQNAGGDQGDTINTDLANNAGT